MRFVVGAIMAAAIAGVAFVQPAEARCFWNGFETVCVHRHHFGFFHRPFFAYRSFDRPYWWGGY
jgi:hypothetical protein